MVPGAEDEDDDRVASCWVETVEVVQRCDVMCPLPTLLSLSQSPQICCRSNNSSPVHTGPWLDNVLCVDSIWFRFPYPSWNDLSVALQKGTDNFIWVDKNLLYSDLEFQEMCLIEEETIDSHIHSISNIYIFYPSSVVFPNQPSVSRPVSRVTSSSNYIENFQ